MFENILGNEYLKKTFFRLKTAGRIPNAMLFAGPDGVGKRLFATEIARSFVCQRPEDGLACGECPACVRAGQFNIPNSDNKDDFKRVLFSDHPDIGIVVAHNRFILVDAIRDLETEAHFRPYEGRARTFIVDEADKMNDAASNALLKTLEEPAPTSHIILITSRPDSLLATIRSRCQIMRFAPVSTGEIERYLIEKKAFSQREAAIAARVASGSIGRALSINVTQFCERRETMLAVVTQAIKTGDRVAMLRLSEEINDTRNKDSFEENLGILESVIHDVWSIGTGHDISRIVNADLADRLSALADSAHGDDLAAWLAAIQTIRENLAVNINRRMATDALLIGMTA